MISPNQRLEQLRELAIETAEDMARSEALFLSIGDGAIATDENGFINRVNKVALHILGFQEKDIMGKLFHDIIVATDDKGIPIPADSRPIVRSFRSRATVMSRCYYIRKDGTFVPVSITVSPIMLEDKQIGAVEVFRDITREIEVERTQSDFISIASHQLRTPATAVKTYLAMLMNNMAGQLTEQQLKYIHMAFDSNERQLHIVNDLLITASSEAGSLVLKKSECSLSDLVTEAVKEFIEIADERNHVLLMNIEDDLVASVDESYIKMVIENLLSNACKYTPRGGKITVGLKKYKSNVRLTVQDNGVGISTQQRSKLFKKFSRIENPLSGEAGGSGIGLYLLNQIVELHKGTITVDSKENSGATFIVSLPIK